MRIFLLLTIALSCLSTFAADSNLIIKLDESSAKKLSLYLDNGEIVDILKSNKRAISQARDAFSTNEAIKILDKVTSTDYPDTALEVEIVVSKTPYTPEVAPRRKIKNLYSREAYNRIRFRTRNPLEKSKISIAPTYEAAQEIMNSMNGGTREESQCYNRAHMWTYEALIQNNVNLGKVWIFFTKKYIREIGHKWWFHVAPYTHVGDDTFRYVLDRGFTMVPYTMENWKNIFIKNKANCPVVTDYNHYDKRQNSAYCYLIYSSQYYWQPWQLERLSEKKIRFWGYKSNELTITYNDALITWSGHIPTLDPRVHTGRRYSTIDGETSEDDTDRPEGDNNGAPSISVRYSRGDSVIDNSFRTGQIVEVLSSTSVAVNYDNSGGESVVDVRSIGKRLRSAFSLSEDQRVLVGERRTGKVRRIYSNGIFFIDYDNASDHFVRYSADVAGEVSYLNGFSRKTRFIDGNGNKGKVRRVYSNGKVDIDYDSRRVRDIIVDHTYIKRR